MARSDVMADQSESAGRGRLATRGSIWYRLGAASGLVFVVLFVAAIAISSFPPNSDAGIVRYYKDPGVESASLIHFFLVMFGCFFLLWFLSTMRTLPVTAEPGIVALAQLAFIGGVVTAVMFLLTSALSSGMVETMVRSGNSFRLDPNTARVVEGGVGYLAFKTASIASAVWVGPAAVLIIRTRTFPIWLAWLGLAVAVGLLLSWFLDVGYLLLFFWVVITSVVMVRRGPQGATESGQPSV